jgi:hypothetical protein
MPRFLAVLVLACVSGVARADDEAIVNRLRQKGLVVLPAHDCSLQSIYLARGFDDSDLADLCELRCLKYLILTGPGFTDAGLRRLEGLGKLTGLDFIGCPNITTDGVARLRRTLPNCSIRY